MVGRSLLFSGSEQKDTALSYRIYTNYTFALVFLKKKEFKKGAMLQQHLSLFASVARGLSRPHGDNEYELINKATAK